MDHDQTLTPTKAETVWSTALDQPITDLALATADRLLAVTRPTERAARRDVLRLLRLADGSECGQRTYTHAMVSGLACPGDRILVALTSTDLLHGQGMLIALDASGQTEWHWPADGDVRRVSAPAVGQEGVYLTADGQSLVTLDLADGAERGRVRLDASASLAAPAIAADAILVPCRGPHLLALGLDGELCWHFTDEAPNAWLDKTPVVVGDRLFAVLSTGVALALDVADGTLAWRADVGSSGKPLSRPATDGQRLYVGARDGVHALSLTDGDEIWHSSTQRRVQAASVVHAGVVYATSHDHYLYALDAASGRALWQYELARRIELGPVLARCGEPLQPCIIVADRGGRVTLVRRPLSVSEHEAAGHWLEAAQLHESLGHHVQAAERYEQAESWQKAAQLWRVARRPLRQAEALEQHARALDQTTRAAEDLAAAWQAAARAFATEGEVEHEAACRREVARCLQLPIITMDIELNHDLVLNAWSRLRFIVRNAGFGPARNLFVRASGEQFKGQVMETQRITTLRAGRQQVKRLNVYPLECGESVPLGVRVDYVDRTGAMRACEQTIHVPVAREETDRGPRQTIRVFVAAGGAAAVGDGATAAGPGGVVVGGDACGPIMTGDENVLEDGSPGEGDRSDSRSADTQ